MDSQILEAGIDYIKNNVVLFVAISFLAGLALKKMNPVAKAIAYLLVFGLEYAWMPGKWRKMLKRVVHNILNERQRKLLDDYLGNKGYLHKGKK